jgi:uncharacterized protein YyaL (SSP411 family)
MKVFVRCLFVSALAIALVPDRSVAQDQTPSAATPAPPTESQYRPLYARGIDFKRPSQVAFQGWPPKELIERPYWLPWGGITFERAQLFNRPIFLLVTVPWNRAAQRMQKRAFADPSVLRYLNENYISIAVRADRRPDLHARYATGGWPAISLLLPDGSPMLSQANPQKVALPITLGYAERPAVLFHLSQGRIYFDKWQNVLHGVSELYEKRVDVEDAKPGPVEESAVDFLVKWLLGSYDAKNGGFGVAPKIVSSGLMELALLRENRQLPALVAPARSTLAKWCAGPLHDPRDGGFHRMATAPGWGGIEYEKMLDVNADLLRDLVFAVRDQDDPALRGAAADTAKFIATTLARPGGGFYNGQIADPNTEDGGGYWQAVMHNPSKAPPIDRLVLAGNNAIAGSALLRAALALGDDALFAAGRGAIELVLANSVHAGRGAQHVLEPEPDTGRFLVTQVDVAFGLLDAYETTGDPRDLAAAKDVAVFVRNNMRTEPETAYRDHLETGAEFGLLDVPYRPMADNARLARVLTRLQWHGAITNGVQEALAILKNYDGDLTIYGPRGIEAALATEEARGTPVSVTIEGSPEDPAARALRRAALSLPRALMVVKTAPAAKPRAVLEWRGVTESASTPAEVPAAYAKLVDAALGAP